MVDDRLFLNVADHGAEWYPGAAAQLLHELRTVSSGLPENRAGIRLKGMARLEPFLASSGSIGSLAAAVLGPESRPVRAILFDKTADANWSLAWHQDRTICVRQKRDVQGFGPWTVKAGMQHVAPPVELLNRMVTLRVHRDDVPLTNAPLLIAPGSHREGRISIDRIGDVVSRCGTRACTADAGDVWLYATLVLHASEVASFPEHRRVLQVDFAAEDLPGGLEWLGV